MARKDKRNTKKKKLKWFASKTTNQTKTPGKKYIKKQKKKKKEKNKKRKSKENLNDKTKDYLWKIL